VTVTAINMAVTVAIDHEPIVKISFYGETTEGKKLASGL
jgi:hypothetical protein